MQNLFLLLVISTPIFLTTFTYAQKSFEKDSISWAYNRIDQGIKQTTDSTVALKSFKDALRIGFKAQNSRLLYNSFFRIGYHYYRINDRAKAVHYFKKSIEHENQLSSKDLIFNTYYYIAVIHYLNDDYSLALDNLTASEKSAFKKPNIKRRLLSYSLRIKIYSYLNQLELAQQLLNQSIKISLKETGQPYLHSLYETMADLARKRKDYDKAIAYYLKSNNSLGNRKTSDVPKYKSYNYNQIGNCYLNKKQFQSAKKYYLMAQKNAEENNLQYYNLTNLLALIGLETELGNYKKAFNNLAHFDSKDDKNDIGLQIVRNNRAGDLYFKTNKLDSALFYYKRSLRFTEERKDNIDVSRFRIGFNSMDYTKPTSIARIYKIFYENTNSIAFFDSLFKYSNISRSRSLFENTSQLDVSSSNPYSTSVEKLDDFYKNIRTMEKPDSMGMEKLDGLKYTIISKRVELFRENANAYKKVTRKEYQKYLSDNNSSSIIYTINEKDQFALYLDGQNAKVINLNLNPDSLKGIIKGLIESVLDSGRGNLEFNAELAHLVFLSLWEPIEKRITIPKNVIIIPDQDVLNFPFDLLLEKAPEKASYSKTDQPKYVENLLVQKYNFSYLPSANIIKAFKKKNENEDVLLIGNPHFRDEYNISTEIKNHTGWVFDPLVYSNAEIKSIKEYFGNAFIFSREEAAKGFFKNQMRSSKIIHFATHAFIDTVFDLFSGLVLTMPDDLSDNGFLLGYEIDQLDLNCDLVTLSACESGGGKIVSAEGVMGLPRLFLNSGARSVLMTLWKIDDRQSATLTPGFYKNITQKNLSKIEALGEAKRMFLNNRNYKNGSYYSHPFYWAAFSLYGDAGKINNTEIKSEQNILLFSLLLIITGLLSLGFFYHKRFKNI